MKILMTGGTGLIGTEISKQLLNCNHEVVYLSRHPGKNKLGIKEFAWDPDRGKIDTKSLVGVETIVNLAGATLNKRWTPSYKSTVIRSRVDSTRLLFNSIQKNNFPVKSIVSASAVGYYPSDLEKLYSEETPPGSDFLSTVCQKWEKEVQNFEELGIRTVRCRIGIVLSNKDGALPLMALPVKFGLGAPLGNGKQWMPWIHIQDVAGIFVHIIENKELNGVFNAVGPYNVTNEELTRRISKVIGRPFFMPNVPSIVLKLALGEMAETALASTKVSNEKIAKSGYKYRFTELDGALEDLLK